MLILFVFFQLSQDFVWADNVSNICGSPVLLLDLDRLVVCLICIIQFGNCCCVVNQKNSFELFLRCMRLRTVPLSLFIVGLFASDTPFAFEPLEVCIQFFICILLWLSCCLLFPCGSVFLVGVLCFCLDGTSFPVQGFTVGPHRLRLYFVKLLKVESYNLVDTMVTSKSTSWDDELI